MRMDCKGLGPCVSLRAMSCSVAAVSSLSGCRQKDNVHQEEKAATLGCLAPGFGRRCWWADQ